MSDFTERLRWAVGPEPLRIRYVLGMVISMIIMVSGGVLSNLWSPLTLVCFIALLSGAYFGGKLILFDSKVGRVRFERWEARMQSQSCPGEYIEPHPDFGEIPNRKPKNSLMENPLE